MFLPFICLALPEDSPFWTAKENNGMWEDWARSSKRTVLEKPGMVLVNHGSSGSSEIISGKVYDDDHNYSKLVFNTHFPWENHNPKGGTSQEYSFRSLDPRDLRGVDINFYLTGRTVDNTASKSRAIPLRKASSSTASATECFTGNCSCANRRTTAWATSLTSPKSPCPAASSAWTAAASPSNTNSRWAISACRTWTEKAEVLNVFQKGRERGITASIPGRQLALVAYSGWDEVESQVHRGFNAEADESTVLYVHRKRTAKNPAMELMITAMLHKTEDSAWTPEELSPVKDVRIIDVTESGSVLGAEITLADGAVYSVDFKDVDGLRNC